MYAVAGEAAAQVAGVSYEELVRTKVLRPLGLTNTGFSQKALKEFENHAISYDAASLKDAQKGNFIRGELDDSYLTDAPAGDIYSNVLDLARWGRAILKGGEVDGKQVLNKESVNEMLTGRTFVDGARRIPEFSPILAYGLGWGISSYKGYSKFSHSGWVNGFNSSIVLYPELDLVVSVLVNVCRSELTLNLSHYIVDELLDLPRTKDWLYGESLKGTEDSYKRAEKTRRGEGSLPERIPNKRYAHSLKEYAGEYTNLALGDISVVYEQQNSHGEGEEEGELTFRTLAFGTSELEHYHFEMFTTTLSTFGFAWKVAVKFEMGTDGAIHELLLDTPGNEKPSVFKKKNVPVNAAKKE
ncbi:hypothetical protein EC991_000136 [Linnemannia zychae]|nr:hypothetical protein EC991_000136 [Linnemannia zychae]